jgi:hypothetical protein
MKLSFGKDFHIWAILFQVATYTSSAYNWINIHFLCFQVELKWESKNIRFKIKEGEENAD